ncbi:MAG TPA: serine hydrolase domain-containing protein [Ornithinicoccus sp.]|nr:serine hydrolase domain-containing protein [Ornithinicoccus sp.]
MATQHRTKVEVDRDSARLMRHLHRVQRRRGSLPEPQVLVRGPGLELTFGDQELPFHAASVGKVMTATLIGMLLEQGRFDVSTPIGRLLPERDLAGLPAAAGVTVSTDVTVEHLLTHTSGLPDYFEPPRGTDTAASATSVVADRDRYWSSADLLEEVRHLPPVGRPGERFAYGDTAYVLLGRIAEEATGQTFSQLLRELIFDPAGMAHSSTPYSDARSSEDVAHLRIAPFWLGREELSTALAVSVDWAGGGIVSTPDDLVRFQTALHGDRFVSEELREWMARPRHRLRPGIHYGAGLVTLRFGGFFPLLRNLPQPVGGIGAFATQMFYYPRQETHVVLNFHSSRQMARSVRTHIRIAQVIARRS